MEAERFDWRKNFWCGLLLFSAAQGGQVQSFVI
jgi:hypothetical protein